MVVATPARMIDHIWNAQSFGLEEVEILVLDEADRMLDMGFKEQVLFCFVFLLQILSTLNTKPLTPTLIPLTLL